MRGWRILALVALLLLIVPVVTACGSQSTGQQQVQVTRGDLTIKANGSGKVEVETDAKPSFGNGGKLVKLNIKEGDKVTKGMVLAQLETDNLELALSQAKVNEAQARIGLTKSQVDLTQAQVALTQAQVALTQAQSGVSQAEAGLNQAQFNLDRTQAVSDIKDKITGFEWQIKIAEMRIQETLSVSDKSTADYWNIQILLYQRDLADQYKKLADLLDNDEYTGTGALTYNIFGQTYDRLTVEDVRAKQLQIEIAQQSVEQAKQSVDQARQSVDQAKQSVELAGQNIEGAQSSLDQATKAVQLAQKQLNDATIIAPIDGTVVTLNVKEGDNILSDVYINSVPIYLIDTSTMEVTAQIDEIDIAGVKLGQAVIINLDSAPDVKYAGTVKSISMAPAVNSQNSGVVVYEVKVTFNSPPPFEVKLGMSATVDIVTTERQGVLLVSNRAIKEDARGNPAVDVLVNQKVESRSIQTGVSDGINTEVISGLNEGDTVVITRNPESTSLFGQ